MGEPGNRVRGLWPRLGGAMFGAARRLHVTLPARLSLLALLMRREVLVRTSGTLLGGLWMIVQPALQMLGLWIFLAVIWRARVSGQVSFLNYFLVGMLVWTMVNEVFQRSLTVLVEYGPMYQRAVFPVGILPLVPLLVSGLIYGMVAVVAVTVLEGARAVYGCVFIWGALMCWLLPLAYLLAVIGLFVKEARQLFPFVLTVLFYLTPILYLPEQMPASMRALTWINPLADVFALVHAAVQQTSWTGSQVLRLCGLWVVAAPAAWSLFRRATPHMREAL